MTLTDVYTPEGQAPAPYSLEGMWEDHERMLKRSGESDAAIALIKPHFYKAAYVLVSEMLHFVDRDDGGIGGIVKSYHDEAAKVYFRDLDSPINMIPDAKSLASN